MVDRGTGKTSRLLLRASLEMLKGNNVIVYVESMQETRRHLHIVVGILTGLHIPSKVARDTVRLEEEMSGWIKFLIQPQTRYIDERLSGIGLVKVFYDNCCTIDSFNHLYRFLSNFYPCSVFILGEGEKYPSVEHAYQASKTADVSERHRILHASTPGKAKKLGQEVLLRSDWDKVKLGIMRELLISKFQNKSLFAKLLNTGDAVLIEGNSWGDDFWGVCTQRGQNHLGELLMELRDDAGAIL